jgi:D-mannonate dehydratase
MPDFHEELVDNGDVDMKRAMATDDTPTYADLLRGDLPREIVGDAAFPWYWDGHRSIIISQGHIQAMLETIMGERPV